MYSRYFIPVDIYELNNNNPAQCLHNSGTISIGRTVTSVSQGLLLFELNIPDQIEIIDAMLLLQVHSQYDYGTTKTFGIYKAIQNWLPSPSCPGSPPGHQAAPIAMFNVDSSTTNISISIASLVADWLVDPQRNFGLIIKSIDESIQSTMFKVYAIGYSNSTRWPAVDTNYRYREVEITGSLEPNISIEQDPPVITTDAFTFSPAQQYAGAFMSTFFVANVGLNSAEMQLQISSDGVNYITDGLAVEIASGEEKYLVPQIFGNYMRIAYRSKNTGQGTTLNIRYVAKLV